MSAPTEGQPPYPSAEGGYQPPEANYPPPQTGPAPPQAGYPPPQTAPAAEQAQVQHLPLLQFLPRVTYAEHHSSSTATTSSRCY